MQILLIGPYPPPHGGISVHVAQARRLLRQEGHDCRVLNLSRGTAPSGDCISAQNGWEVLSIIWDCGRRKWILHCHINGHNTKSWLLALLCGVAGVFSPGRVLTIHSGMSPAYMEGGRSWQRLLARLATAFYHRIICVSPEVEAAVLSLRVAKTKLEVLPAFLPAENPRTVLPAWLKEWMESRRPLLSTALSFSPEYAFDVLVEALAALQRRHQQLGCVVLGGGAQLEEAHDLVRKYGLEDEVLLLGDVDHDLALTLMAGSQLFVRATLKDGDAVSVREALSLGVPAVASDVGMRPPGTVLCRPGDPLHLLSKIDALLTQPGDAAGTSRVPSADGFRRLLDIYRPLAQTQPEVRRPAPRAGGIGLEVHR